MTESTSRQFEAPSDAVFPRRMFTHVAQWVEGAGSSDAPDLAEIDTGTLEFGFSPRQGPYDPSYVRSLAERIDDLPPIVVHEGTGRVIDGIHRVMAARSLNRDRVRARIFRGTEAEAAVEAVRLNVAHGKPLTLGEREHAALKILATASQWSDRRIAEVCGLSPKTVGGLRRKAAGSSDLGERRIGRDGRARPADALGVRQRIVEVLEEQPGASVRTVASIVGASPATVNDVRKRLAHGVPPSKVTLTPRPESCDRLPEPERLDRPCIKDPAFVATQEAQHFAEWFDRTAFGSASPAADAVPLGRIYPVVDECRRRAAAWNELALALEKRARRQVSKVKS